MSAGVGGGGGGGLTAAGGGMFAPRGATLRAMLLSVRTTQVSGFDLRGFNAFAAGRAFVSDIGEVEAKEGGVCIRMSEPYTLGELEFAPSEQALEEAARAAKLHVDASGSEEAGAAAEGPVPGTIAMTATRGGVFNCVAVWYELHLTDAETIDLGPSAASPGSDAPADTPAAAAAAAAATAAGFPPGLTSSRGHVDGGAPLPYTMRARAQRLHFVGYERRLGAGETVRVQFRRTHSQLSVTCEPGDEEGAALAARGDLVRWPTRNSLGYHFSMIADTTRNGCFDRAIVSALARRPELRTHVLDIGSGSGLLAMMAVRAGATRVSSLEMVPAMAAVARHCVQANGMADRIRIHEMKSTDIEADAIGGRAGMLVCELVDNEMLGEGTLFSIADARRRLLVPKARVVPRGGSLFALPIEVKTPRRAGGLHLDELRLFNTDACFREGKYSNDGRKMQLLGEDEWAALGAPLRLFDFDWESEPVDSLCDPRVTTVSLTVTQSGTLNAFLVYFHLACDDEDANTMSTGPDDVPFPAGGPPTHWDSSLRYLPCEVSVEKGASLRVVARHTDTSTQLGVVDVSPSALRSIGHTERVRSGERLSVGAATCGATVHLLDPLGQGAKDAVPAGAPRGGSEKVAASAVRAALDEVLELESMGRTIPYNPSLAVMLTLGQMSAETLAASDPSAARIHGKFARLASSHGEAAMARALRKFLAPNELVAELAQACAGARWVLATEVLCATRLVDNPRIRRDVLLMLRDKLKLYTREEWADAFGMPFWRSFASHTSWGEITHGATALVERALASAEPGGARSSPGSLKRFSLDEMLVMGRPHVPEGYMTPLAWFARSMVHPNEIVTTEACEALASYLSRRHRQLGGTGSLVEVGAGDGRLAHHLNATGFLPTRLIATDVKPVPTPSAPGGAFPCAPLDHSAAIAQHGPVALVICAWMTPGEDWTPAFRAARVPEYVLLGDCCANPAASYNREHAGYERVLLKDVSRHMLHFSDAQPELAAKRGGGVACAVAYRRKTGSVGSGGSDGSQGGAGRSKKANKQ